MAKVLEGIRVLDFGRYYAAPYCGTLLADMGAEVIRVERPGGAEDRELGPLAPNGEALAFGIILHRNQKGITLNLHNPKAAGILKALVKLSDVVLENFGVGTPEAKVLDYQSLRETNPAIILVSVSGFGEYGPYAQRVCFDAVAQAMSGVMSFTGFPNNPPTRLQLPYVDFSTATNAALGTMFALYHRERTGVGQMVSVSLMDTAVSYVAAAGIAAEYKVLGYVRQQEGNHAFWCFADSFKTRNGYVVISVVGNSLWRRFLRAIGREDLLDDPRFGSNKVRWENRHQIVPMVAQWMAERTVDEVMAILDKARIPCGPLYTVADMVSDPHVKAREMLVDLEYPGVGLVPHGAIPIRLSETPGGIETRAPMIGEHNQETYCGLLGFSGEELTRLQEEGVI